MEEFKDNEMIVDEWVRSDTGEVFSSYDDLVASRETDEFDMTLDEIREIVNGDNNQFDFLFRNGNIRYFIKDDKVWFIGKDICDYLEYGNANEAIRDHVSDTNVLHFTHNDICRGLSDMAEYINREMYNSWNSPEKQTIANRYSLDSYAISRNGALCITEQGVYELCRFSRMPKANDFYEWIHNRVLPSIRKTGAYMTPNTMNELYTNPDKVREIIDENLRLTAQATQEKLYADYYRRSCSDLNKIIKASDNELVRIADQATFEAEIYRKEKDRAWDKVGSLKVKNSDLTQRISYLESKLNENNIVYSNEHPKVQMCHVVDNIHKKTNIMDIINNYKGE